jgi:hypothetical protein
MRHQPALLAGPRLLASLTAACSLLAVAAQAAPAAAPCTPPGQLRSAQVARADRPDGTSELTEYLAGGEYRVTRCGASGRMTVSQTVSPIADPDGGVVLVPTETEAPGRHVATLYGDPSEPSWAKEFRAARAALRAAVIPPTVPATAPPAVVAPSVAAAGAPGAGEPGSAAPAAAPRAHLRRRAGRGGQTARAAVAADACTNSQYKLWTGVWAARSYGYQINRGRFSYNDTTVASLVDGHRAWDLTRNSCGLADITNLTSAYVGSTSATIHSYPDGYSITDKGDLASVGCAGALACTWNFTNAAGATTETDQRYNENITFSNVGAAGAYDYESISTHESGHSIGLDHANTSDALTMYYAIRAGTTHARTLAKGDVLGLRARYP